MPRDSFNTSGITTYEGSQRRTAIMVTAPSKNAATTPTQETKPYAARLARMVFPEDDDIPDRTVVVYYCRPTRH
jgi:hypothetical protein